MKVLILLSLIFSIKSFSQDLYKAPPSFYYKWQRLVWIDIEKATYEITFNHLEKKNNVKTTFYFKTSERGYPIFDLVNKPLGVYINGKAIANEETDTPDFASKVRYAKELLDPGTHKMEIYSEITEGVKYQKKKGVSAGFFILDLTDRKFLEQYLPTNYEYDQYKMDFHVRILNTDRYHNVFANGDVKTISPFEFKISYPEYYNASSVYFHLVPLTKFKRLYFNYSSIDGREIPVTIYSTLWSTNSIMKKKVIKEIAELENDYGPWPHPRVLVYAHDISGGMEYPGATMSSLISIGHELQHSYFAKGILPKNGNSGWMDEAIASWKDKGYKTIKKPFYVTFNLGNHSVYTRKTDSHSYKYGRDFIGYLDYILKSNSFSGMKEFLKFYFEKRKYTTVSTQDFIDDLESYSGLPLKDYFDQYIFGISNKNDDFDDINENSIHHPNYSKEEIYSII